MRCEMESPTMTTFFILIVSNAMQMSVSKTILKSLAHFLSRLFHCQSTHMLVDVCSHMLREERLGG